MHLAHKCLDKTWFAERCFKFELIKPALAVNSNDGEISNCAICLEGFGPEREVLLLDCRHVFHHECGVKWFVNN